MNNILKVGLFLVALLTGTGAALAQFQPVAPRPALPQSGAALKQITIGFIDLDGDPRYEPMEVYQRHILKDLDPAYQGAEMGVEDSVIMNRSTGAEFKLQRFTLKSADAALAAVQEGQGKGISFFLIDLPASAYKAVAAGVKGKDVLLFNVSAPEDTLRRDMCSAEFVHVYPSRAQLMDGLVQLLVSKKWRDYLVLEGQTSEDAEMTKAFVRSTQKFGARVVAQKTFEAGSDPRKRELNNPALLSAINRDWDITFVADSAFDFARTVSYQTVRPRPVVGSIDLEPSAWHWTWERNGAPQVNTRFHRISGGRKMAGHDWSAWMAVKMVVQAVVRTRSTEFPALRNFILKDGSFDPAKGLAASVRPWDHQVRQSIILATPFSITASAPMAGFLHRLNELDSLGDDEADTPCKLNR